MKLKNKEIAEMLNISTTAVSLAINNRPGVSEETRRKVMELLRDSMSDTAAPFPNEGNATAPTGSILISMHKKHGAVMNDKPFFSTDLLGTIQQEAMVQGYTVMIANFMPGMNLDEYMNYLRSTRCDGIIVFGTEIDQEDLDAYLALEKPVVLMDTSFDDAKVDAVALDNQNAMYRAVRYAYEMGHRRIGYLQSDAHIMNFVHSYDGYCKALREFGLEEEYHPLIELPTTIDAAYQEMQQFLSQNPKFEMPTIFIAELDYIALGAMKALKEAGYRVPEDVSFIGYDDVDACTIAEPMLTTNCVNHFDIGRLAMLRLIDRIRHPEAAHTTTQVGSELIVRDSVRDLR